MHMGAENMAKKAAKRKNTRKNTGSRKNGGRNRLWIIFAGCCIALALAVAAVFQKPVRRHFSYPMEYEAEVRRACEKYDLDPCLVFAVIRTESFFTPDAVSGAGAQGLMQIMPAVARQFDVVSEEALLDPETNVLLANKVWNRIDSTLDLPAGISEKDRMSLILACYNGGIGHVNDARRLARVNGEDPNSWEVVLRYLELKSDPAYYQHEVVKCGKFTGYRQTRAFVQDVMNRYNKYCRIAQL